ncbi:MAG: InlB B-repeat-containing protein [Acutalibacteraceae bacterium]
MIKSRLKSIISAVVAVVLMSTCAVSVSAAAQKVEYNPSESYKNSSYYSKLMSVELTGDNAKDIVNVAKSQVGYHEGSLSGNTDSSNNITEYGRWFGNQGSAWCNMFVSWCAYVAGVDVSVLPKLTSATNSYYSTMASVGAQRFSFSSGRSLKPGDLIFVCADGGYGCIDHIGLVADVDDTTIYTVEGNLSDSVKACEYSVSSGYSSYYHARINYVARPNYEDNLPTAKDITDATSVKIADNTVYAVYDAKVTEKEAISLSNNSLAVAENDKDIKTILSLVKDGVFDEYYISTEDGVKVLNKKGKITEPSQNLKTGFVTKIKANEVVPVNAASLNNTRYEVYDLSVSYSEAKAIAKAKGGALAVVENADKAMMLSFLLKDSDMYYTGTTGSKKALDSLESLFADEKLTDYNIVAVKGGEFGKLAVAKSFDKTHSTGFIVEYDDTEKVTVTYDANGGENAPIEKIAEKGEEVVVTGAVPTKEGKEFKGWSYSRRAKEIDFYPYETISPAENTTLYAVWR